MHALALMALAQGPLHRGREPLHAVLEHVIVSAGMERLDRAVLADVAGNENERDFGPDFPRDLQRLGAVELAEGKIRQDKVEVSATDFLTERLARGDEGDFGLGPLLPEEQTHEFGIAGIVFQVENSHRAGAEKERGSVAAKRQRTRLTMPGSG